MERASTKIFYTLPVLLFAPSSLLLPLSECTRSPAMFIFGDSLIDNGNNNYLSTIAKANYPPYGVDFGFPTGRFCNGFTVTDYAAKLIGLPLPVPYLSLGSKTAEILQGVNYASAAAGILDATGRHYGERITFNGQIALFEKTVSEELSALMPDLTSLSQFLGSSLFIINVGSNDYINNYLLPNLYATSREYTADAFADLLISNFEVQLQNLYEAGARKMVIVGIGPLGCIPSQLFQRSSADGSCIESVNEQVSLFNRRLFPLLTKLNSTLTDLFFVYENIFDTFLDMITNPSSYGFTEKNQACCGSGKYGGQFNCLPLQQPCLRRESFIFWDSFHPTQAANKIIAERCYGPEATDCSPISAYMLSEL